MKQTVFIFVKDCQIDLNYRIMRIEAQHSRFGLVDVIKLRGALGVCRYYAMFLALLQIIELIFKQAG